jgi:hypothetical protein
MNYLIQEYYSPLGTPVVVSATNTPIRAAVEAYRNYRADPIFGREPDLYEVRRVVEYCAYYINAPCFSGLAGIRALRAGIEQVRTVDELGGWLSACKALGFEPV